MGNIVKNGFTRVIYNLQRVFVLENGINKSLDPQCPKFSPANGDYERFETTGYSPSAFPYCKQSNTVGGIGLGTRLYINQVNRHRFIKEHFISIKNK